MLSDTLQNDLKDAMRAKDAVRLRTIRALRAALKDKEIAQRQGGSATLTEEEELSVLQKQAKQRREAIEQYQEAGRSDLVQAEQEELDVINEYLPKQLSDEDLAAAVKTILAELGELTPQSMGKAMGETMRALKGQADGRRIQAVVKGLLNNG